MELSKEKCIKEFKISLFGVKKYLRFYKYGFFETLYTFKLRIYTCYLYLFYYWVVISLIETRFSLLNINPCTHNITLTRKLRFGQLVARNHFFPFLRKFYKLLYKVDNELPKTSVWLLTRTFLRVKHWDFNYCEFRIH